MSKYNNYAKELDKAFKDAREEFNSAYEEMKVAEQALSIAQSMGKWEEKRVGERERRIQLAERSLEDAKHHFQEVERDAWPKFSEIAGELTRKLEKEIEEDRLLNPDEIDEKALRLLDDGLVTSPEDFENLSEKYAGNAVMLKYVGKAARKAADGMKDSADAETRGRLRLIAERTEKGRTDTLRNWDSIVDAASIYNGSRKGSKDAGLIQRLSNRWEEGTAKSIESF